MSPGVLPILTYHAFGPARDPLTTDPAWFAETLASLVESGWVAVELDDWIARGRPDVARGFAVTIDDGLRSLASVVDVLARLHVPATVFVVTDRVGAERDWPGSARSERLLGWSELNEFAAAGLRICAHGRTHARLDRLDDAALDDELRGSRDAIEQRLGVPCRLFAYPYGRATPRVRQAAARLYAAAFGTTLAAASRAQDPFDLARIDACYLRTPDAWARLVSGRWRGWLRVRRALRDGRQALLAP